MAKRSVAKSSSESLAVVRRGEIMAAMERLIARSGLEAATARKIADEMGATIGAIWHYYPDKAALFAALAESSFDRWFEAANAASGMAEPWDRFEALFLNAASEYGAEHGAVWFALLQKSRSDEEFRELFNARYRTLREFSEELFRECQAQGSIRADLDPVLECQRLFALADGLAVSAISEPTRVTDAVVTGLIGSQLRALRPKAT